MKRRRRRGLGAPKAFCKLPSSVNTADATPSVCATSGKQTFCVGDTVQRTLKSLPSKLRTQKGIAMAVTDGADNRGKKSKAVNVCFESDSADDLAYPYLFKELKKV